MKSSIALAMLFAACSSGTTPVVAPRAAAITTQAITHIANVCVQSPDAVIAQQIASELGAKQASLAVFSGSNEPTQCFGGEADAILFYQPTIPGGWVLIKVDGNHEKWFSIVGPPSSIVSEFVRRRGEAGGTTIPTVKGGPQDLTGHHELCVIADPPAVNEALTATLARSLPPDVVVHAGDCKDSAVIAQYQPAKNTGVMMVLTSDGHSVAREIVVTRGDAGAFAEAITSAFLLRAAHP